MANISPNIVDIIPITRARAKLGQLTEKARGENYIVLTKGAKTRTALVDLEYLNRLQEEIKKIYGKTFIDPNLLPYTRIFSDKEIKEWQEEDSLA